MGTQGRRKTKGEFTEVKTLLRQTEKNFQFLSGHLRRHMKNVHALSPSSGTISSAKKKLNKNNFSFISSRIVYPVFHPQM
jgi:hypothetical protein